MDVRGAGDRMDVRGARCAKPHVMRGWTHAALAPRGAGGHVAMRTEGSTQTLCHVAQRGDRVLRQTASSGRALG